MAIQPMALGVNNPEINAVSALAAGQQARQSFDMNNVQIAKAGLETIGSIALGAMGGNIDGQADPALFNEGLDYLAQQGVNVDQFRDRADLAPVIARSSMTALQQMQMAQDERSYQLALDKFEQDVMQAAQAPASSFSQTPVFLTDPDGNQHVGQMSSGGGVLINGQQLPGIPQGWSVVNRPQALSTINDGSQISTLNPNLGPNAGTVAPVATIQGAPSANMNVTVDPEAGRTMAPAPGSEQSREVNAGRIAAQNAIGSFERKSQTMTGTLDTAIQQIEANPNLVTGLGGDLTKVVPGSPAYDLAQTLLTIQANIGFDALQQMREASPTGGALGAISDTENRLLQAVQGATAQGQSSGQLLANLRNIQVLSKEVLEDRRRAYAATFPEDAAASQAPSAAPPAASTGEPAKPMTQADYDAIPSGGLFIDPDDGQTYKKP